MKLDGHFLFYVNRSQSFIPPPSSGRATNINSGVRFKNEEGLGYETGIKGSLLDQRLNFTFALFRIDRENVRTTELELLPQLDAQGRPVIDPATGQPVLSAQQVARTEGHERSKGVELDFNWKANTALQLFGGYGYSDSFVIEAGRDLDAVGRRPRSSPEHRASAGLRLARPKEMLNGMVFALGASYTGESPILSPTSNGTASPDGFIRGHNGMRDVMVPGCTVWNCGASYRFRTGAAGGRRFDHRVQLNRKNLCDRKYVATNGRAADRFTIPGTYAFSF